MESVMLLKKDILACEDFQITIKIDRVRFSLLYLEGKTSLGQSVVYKA